MATRQTTFPHQPAGQPAHHVITRLTHQQTQCSAAGCSPALLMQFTQLQTFYINPKIQRSRVNTARYFEQAAQFDHWPFCFQPC
ncbi:hypothetical protein BFI45_22250 (plasmid) [Yersinia pestis subsp. microtus bv. Altaica]|nr:hypothetical protein [Yersinia pestis]OUY09765.1 hypothetical protein BFI40_21980 [Yersinia pestis subsp. microtus bv. Altaica]OVY75723.1 hypothetical protein BFI52_22335 [Yersinia pestis subsp. microtus]OUY11357.1 hypothetical protein BFI42_22100 [Yersinia pestis subsp. microtus bv. Altaica]OUY86858.1 hypothetical protein BFI44_22065 [Yersinia pestis subsp. microtus bv. Altaica]